MKKEKFVNIDLERDIVAIAMSDAEAFAQITEILKPEHFHEKKLGKLFGICEELRKKGLEADMVSVYNVVIRRGWENFISPSDISEISSSFITSANAKYNAAFLYELWLRRATLRKLEQIRKDLEKDYDVFELLDESGKELRELANPISEDDEDGMRTLGEELDEYFREIHNERISGNEVGIRSKEYPTFNRTEGLRPGNIVVISGAYKSGKTTFAVALALDFAMQGYGVGIISLEMSKRAEVFPKFVSMATGTRYGYLRNPSQRNHTGQLRYSDERFHKTVRDSAKLEEKKIYIADKTFSAHKVERLIRKWVDRKEVQIVFVDYIGLVQTARGERRDLELKELSRKFKLLAKELDIVIFPLSQENDKRETAESKGLARDADYWFSVRKPSKEGEKSVTVRRNGSDFKVQADNSLFEITCKEARHVESGWKFLTYFKRNGEFVEYDVEHADEFQTKAKEMPF